MTISDLIKNLEIIKEINGDLTVCLYDTHNLCIYFEIRESKYLDFKNKTTYPEQQYLILS